jgi:hypothetical protein
MVTGGLVTLILNLIDLNIFGIDANFYGIGSSLFIFILLSNISKAGNI